MEQPTEVGVKLGRPSHRLDMGGGGSARAASRFLLRTEQEILVFPFCLHFYQFPRASITKFPQTIWLEGTEIYSLIVLEARGVK